MATQAHAGGDGLARRSVGLPTAIGTTFGLIVASSVMLSVAQGFFASYVFLVALVAGLLTMYLAAMSFSELATLIPKAGSMNEYVRAGLGPFFATVTVAVGYVAIVLFPGAAEASIPGFVLTDFLGAGLTFKWWVVILVGFLGLVNLLGVRAFAALEVPATILIATSLLAMGIIGVAGLGTAGDPIGGAFPDIPFTWSLFSALLGLAVFTFVGVEYTCPLAEELRRPERDIPRGIFIGLTLIAVPMLLYGLAAVRYVPSDVLGDPANLTHMNVAIAMLGGAGKWWMGLLSVLAMLSTLNAVAAGVPRILYGMGLTNQLPRFFSYLTPATRAPVVGIVLVTIAPILMNVFDQTTGGQFIELVLAGVLGWATAYVLIHLSQIALRLRNPETRRPYRSPLFPVPQLVGMGLLALAAFKIYPDPEVREDIYVKYGIFLAIAVGFSLLYNLYSHRSLKAIFTPVPLAEVYRETEVIAEEVPVEHVPHPHLPHHEERPEDDR